jgi:hypothetical protein
MATNVAVNAGSMSASVKSKDEITLDIRLQAVADDSVKLTRQFKAKAKSDGDDIISKVVEPAAGSIIEVAGK